MRVLVTGGFGFLGAWVVDFLAHQGHEVFILSRSSEGRSLLSFDGKSHVKESLSYQFIEADLVDETAYAIAQKLPENLDAIIHAASSNDPQLPEYAKSALLVNILGTQNILEALTIKEGSFPLFLYVSTFHVYGKDQGRIKESMSPEPKSDYGLTHFAAEEYCRMFGRKHDIPFILTRCTNGYGAPKSAPFGKWYLLLADMCCQAFYEGKIELRSSPDTRRDFVYMGDVAKTLGFLAQHPELSGSLYNIGNGTSLPIGYVAEQVAETASKILGKHINIITPKESSGSTLDIDVSSVHAATGIVPRIMFKEETIATLSFLQQFGKL